MAMRNNVPEGGNAPTKKWWAALVTSIAALLTMYFATGGWDNEEWIALIALVAQAIVTYLVPNSPTVGGAPAAPSKP